MYRNTAASPGAAGLRERQAGGVRGRPRRIRSVVSWQVDSAVVAGDPRMVSPTAVGLPVLLLPLPARVERSHTALPDNRRGITCSADKP